MKLKLFAFILIAQLFSLPVLAEEEPATDEDEVRYVDLTPAFVTNFGGPGRMKYIKAEVSLRVNSQEAFRAAIYHAPLLRHTMIMLLSQQTDETVANMAGKEQIRLEALEEMRAILETEEGEPMIEDLLFSTFFVQR